MTATLSGGVLTVMPSADTCGRGFYIKATLSGKHGMGIGSGTIADGQMMRCTNKELLAKCPHLGPNFHLTFTGGWDLTTGKLILQIQHVKEIWSKSDCKLARKEESGDVIVLSPPPTPDPPTSPWQKIKDVMGASSMALNNMILKPEYGTPR